MAKRSERIREALLASVALHPRDLVTRVAQRFRVSRAAVAKHARILIGQGWLAAEGTTRKVYRAGPRRALENCFAITADLDESLVWSQHYAASVSDLPANVQNILHYGFSEIVNNARDHSGGKNMDVTLQRDSRTTYLSIQDDGEGIFRHIARLCGLADERLALLELAKGKLTTAPKYHTGEGIFFTSKAFDAFCILSGGLRHVVEARNWEWLEPEVAPDRGTVVTMGLHHGSKRDLKKVFDEFAAPEEFSINRTVVPLKLARLQGENLLSRSQARRVVARFEQFREVLLDFTGVDEIGQAFADEIFRVFANEHPDVRLVPVNHNKAVAGMLRHVGVKL